MTLALQQARDLRRRIAFLSAVVGADELLTAQSERLQAWRLELEVQGFGPDDVEEVLKAEQSWLRKASSSPEKLLEDLRRELPRAEQQEEEDRIELARAAASEPQWDVAMTLAWMRFRDVEQACRFLERRDARVSLWRDGLETIELEECFARGTLRASGVQNNQRHEIGPADWAGRTRDGLRLIRDEDPYAARAGETAAYRQLRLARQAVQHAFPGLKKAATSDGPYLAAARNYLAHGEGRVGWDMLWGHVAETLGLSVSKRRKERLQPKLLEEFPTRFGRGALKRK